MGVSTDAILVWGFDLGTCDDFDEKTSDRFEFLCGDGWTELDAIQARTGVSLISHCCSEEQMYIVGVTSTKIVARRGYPKEVKSLDPPANGQQALADFSLSLGIEAKPGRWILASDWN